MCRVVDESWDGGALDIQDGGSKWRTGIDVVIEVNDQQIEAIREVAHFRESIYRDLDIRGTFEFFTQRFVEPIIGASPIDGRIAVDVACGYGWFALAFILAGGKGAFAVDTDLERLDAARKISRILGVEYRIRFINAGLESLPIPDNGADFVVSIETLEHVGRIRMAASIGEIQRVAQTGVLLTTPNKWFPVIAHDTQLPFLHWLPPKRRQWIAHLFRRSEMDAGNEFLSPTDIGPLRRRFLRVSTCYTFRSYEEYEAQYPLYLPYGAVEANRWTRRPSLIKRVLFRTASWLFQERSYMFLPTMAGLYLRKPG